jgi:ATP-dependent Clp protease protease subunit
VELYTIISSHSGQTFDKVQADSDRDYWMIAQEAKEYGMIDDVLIKNKPTTRKNNNGKRSEGR